MKRFTRPLISGILLAFASTVLFYSPWGQQSEEALGLSFLFQLRGPRHVPDRALIINVDRDTGDSLDLSDRLESLPRSTYARLVETLDRNGAAVVVFDIFFGEEKDPLQDRDFAEAMRQAGNVILVEDLQRGAISPATAGTRAVPLYVEQLIAPAAPLAESALALAPFPLPKIPVRISQCWHFKTSSGNVPTLPVVAFQAAHLEYYDELREIISRRLPQATDALPPSAEEAVRSPGLTETMRSLYQIFQHNNGLGPAVLATIATEANEVERSSLQALANLYAGESCAFIDFYGPPATLTTLSYRDILAADDSLRALIEDRAIFIGAARRTWSNQEDGFYTAFSQADGLDLSGVELAATVFSNLCEDRSVLPTPMSFNLVLFVAAAIAGCLVSSFLPPLFAIGSLLSISGAGLFGSYFLFASRGIWTPLILPLAVMPLAAFLLMTLLNYLTAQRERQRVSTALGFYLPETAVRELSQDLSFISTGDKMVHSVCLLTDAQHYTTLSERLNPEELSELVKEYFEHLFKEVNRERGFVCNTIGDSMLALWPSAQPEIHLRQKACRAALQIMDSVERFNAKHPATPLPTRIGLHAGTILLGNIGAEDHFEYAPVGDTVNTTSRIEGLNKRLGTRVLASEQALQGIEHFLSRQLGRFLLGGKTKPITIYELAGASEHPEKQKQLFLQAFPDALTLFHQRQWQDAVDAFSHCLDLQAEDGPSHFYLQQCTTLMRTPPPDEWQGTIHIGK